jgi:putative salt-induced outer membrane protein YdiY
VSGRRALAAVLVAAAAVPAGSATTTAAADPPAAETAPAPPKPSDVAEFSYVATAGNSEASTLGFKNAYKYSWARASLELKAGGIRTSTTTIRRLAVGPDATTFTVLETRDTARTAESYYLNGRYDHKISDRVYWFAGGGWDRNRFAGVDNRYSAAAGVGNLWIASERTTFRTDYAVTFTRQEDVVEEPGADGTFLGTRLSSKLERRFGTGATYGNDLVVDNNAEETEDLRADMTNWVAVSMTSRLALKVSLQWLYDNVPALSEVPREFPLGTATGETVLVPLDELDTVFTASLVINF